DNGSGKSTFLKVLAGLIQRRRVMCSVLRELLSMPLSETHVTFEVLYFLREAIPWIHKRFLHK
ncbi:hypothetical protein CEH02_08665, partial [Streptococcus pyogenes]